MRCAAIVRADFPHLKPSRPSIKFSQRSSRVVARSSVRDADVAAAMESFAAKYRVPVEEIQQEVDVIESAGKGVYLEDSWGGSFAQKATTDLRQFEPGSTVTLARLSFNTWQPNEMKVKLTGGLQIKGDWDGVPNMYRVDTTFVTPDGIEGVSATVGEFSRNEKIDNRIDIAFTRLELRPPAGITEEGLAKWKETFQEANPTMDEGGSVVVEIPPAKGHLDILYMDNDIHITRGNLGTVAMVERIKS
ncbi:hypothetical protein BSKO_11111 [Bryopsis sp. KO-2023]|nr:hypothetical protein BSKO_11111 [Bryopsis sp. KO-2023]